MLALRFERGKLRVAEINTPRIEEDAGGRETSVRVRLAGICNTDLEIARGYAGFEGTLGHEFVGTIERAPHGFEEMNGLRVVGEINAGCGVCELCKSGDARHCPSRTALGIHGRDGAFAELLTLPIENLLVVPEEVSDEAAVFTEPLAAACGIVERAPQLLEADERTRVAVLGDGKLGILCAQALCALTRASVTLIGKHRNKLAVVANQNIETKLVDEMSGARKIFDTVVEATGAASGFASAIELAKPRGVIVLKSTFHGALEMNSAPVVVDEITIVGSRCGRFAPALELLRTRRVETESLITERFPLREGVRAMQRAGESGAMKILLEP